MEDIGKAIIMVTNVLLFVFATTISIFLYNRLTDSVDGIMLSGNYSNRGDSIVAVEEIEHERISSRAEVILAILGLKEKEQKSSTKNSNVIVISGADQYVFAYYSGDNTIGFSRNGSSVDKEIFNSFDLRQSLENCVQDVDYKLTYNEDGKTLIYTQD